MHTDLDNFQKVYYEKVKPLEEELENEKEEIRIKIAVIVVITISMAALFLILFLLRVIPDSTAGTAGIFGSIVMGALVYSATIEKFTNKVKKAVFPELFKSIDSNIIYDSALKTPVKNIIDSKLFDQFEGCTYEPQDNIIIKVGNKNIQICELSVTSGRNVLFGGLFIPIELDKSVKADIKIVYNIAKDYGLLKTLFHDSYKVNLENIDFEQKYDVYSKDQVYARKMLTLTFMEKLMQVTNKLNTNINMTFVNNKIYIAINGIHVINDGALFSQKIDMLNIAKDIDNILEVIDTIKYLDLEDKI